MQIIGAIAVAAAAVLLAGSAAAQEVVFSDVSVGAAEGVEPGRSVLFVTYTATNAGRAPIVFLGVVIVGRNEAGQIVETQPTAPITETILPNGLAAGEQIVIRAGVVLKNPGNPVASAEVQPQIVRVAD